jgi:hypothetical protein
MLKKIYNFLLVTLLSGSLLMLDFGVKGAQLHIGFSQSYAQTESTTQPTTEKVKLDAAKDNDLMSTLTMVAISLLTQRLWSCKLSTDMMIAAAGGAAYVAGEILATFKLKSVMKDLEKEIKKTGTVTDANNQIEDFKKLKKSYEEAKGSANMKKMLQMAAAAAFAAAGVVAYMLSSQEDAAILACEGALKTGNACQGLQAQVNATSVVLKSLSAARWLPGPSAAKETEQTTLQSSEKTAETSTVGTGEALAASYKATCGTPGGQAACPLIAGCEIASKAITSGCAPLMPILKTNEGFCPAPLSFGMSHSSTSYGLFANSGMKPNWA